MLFIVPIYFGGPVFVSKESKVFLQNSIRLIRCQERQFLTTPLAAAEIRFQQPGIPSTTGCSIIFTKQTVFCEGLLHYETSSTMLEMILRVVRPQRKQNVEQQSPGCSKQSLPVPTGRRQGLCMLRRKPPPLSERSWSFSCTARRLRVFKNWY